MRREYKGALRGAHAASNPSQRAGEARELTTGCTAGARCPRGRSAGAGGGRGSGRQGHRGRRPRRGRPGTRSRSRTLPGRTPPLPQPPRSSWAGRPRCSLSTAGLQGTDALRAGRGPGEGCEVPVGWGWGEGLLLPDPLGGGPALQKPGPQGCCQWVPRAAGWGG